VPAEAVVAAERIAVADNERVGHRQAIVAEYMGRMGRGRFSFRSWLSYNQAGQAKACPTKEAGMAARVLLRKAVRGAGREP
jgi:hypothetical protein